MPEKPTSAPDRWTALRELATASFTGLPAPTKIRFHDDRWLYLSFDSHDHLNAWADTLGPWDAMSQPYPLLGDYREWTTTVDTREPWHGWTVAAKAYDPITEEQARDWVDSGQAAQAAEYAARQATKAARQATKAGEQS